MRIAVVAIAGLLAAAFPALAASYKRGDQVRVHSATGEPDSVPAQRVVAIPGDHVRVERAALYVNDKVVKGLSPELVVTIERWEPQVVPTGHYLVMGEEKHESGTVRSGSLIPVDRIVGREAATKRR